MINLFCCGGFCFFSVCWRLDLGSRKECDLDLNTTCIELSWRIVFLFISCFVWLFCRCKGCTCSLRIWAPLGTSMLVHFDAFAAHAGLIYDVTDPGCQAHTHTHAHAHTHMHTHTHTHSHWQHPQVCFCDFKYWFLTNWMRNQVKNCWMWSFFNLFIPLLFKGPIMLLRFGSPLMCFFHFLPCGSQLHSCM